MLTNVFLRDLEKQDKAFGQQVRKWRPRIQSFSRELSRLTGDMYEDVVQDLLEKMWLDVEAYRTPQVRYQKQLWEVVSESNDILSLQRKDKTLFLPRDLCEKVEKASLGTFLYAGLFHHYCDRLAKHFTGKNGYQVDPEEPTVEKVVYDSEKKVFVKKSYPNHQKVIRDRSIYDASNDLADEVDSVCSLELSPLDEACYNCTVQKMNTQLSEPARLLFEHYIHEFRIFPEKLFGYTKSEVQVLLREIVETLPSELLEWESVVSKDDGSFQRTRLIRDFI